MRIWQISFSNNATTQHHLLVTNYALLMIWILNAKFGKAQCFRMNHLYYHSTICIAQIPDN